MILEKSWISTSAWLKFVSMAKRQMEKFQEIVSFLGAHLGPQIYIVFSFEDLFAIERYKFGVLPETLRNPSNAIQSTVIVHGACSNLFEPHRH